MLDSNASMVAPIHLHACRFFCGPNAKKSAALAKQQKKRPRGDGKQKGKQAVADSDSEDDSDAASDLGTVSACSSALLRLTCCCHRVRVSPMQTPTQQGR